MAKMCLFAYIRPGRVFYGVLHFGKAEVAYRYFETMAPHDTGVINTLRF